MTTASDQPVAVVTGASAGVGKAAAETLAAQGWHVIVHGRTAERLTAAAEDIRAAAAPEARIDVVRADLALLSDTAKMAEEIKGLTDKVHVLLANAGGVRAEEVITPEGNEATFAGNHLGHFLLTERLMPELKAAAKSSPKGMVRVVATSSDGSEMIPGLDWDDLQRTKEWNTGAAYTTAKLCNVMFAFELARRAADDGIIAHAVHPGTVDSNFSSHCDDRMAAYMATLEKRSSTVAGEDLVHVATAPENGERTGVYFHQRTPHDPNPFALDENNCRRLWDESEKLVAKAGV